MLSAVNSGISWVYKYNAYSDWYLQRDTNSRHSYPLRNRFSYGAILPINMPTYSHTLIISEWYTLLVSGSLICVTAIAANSGISWVNKYKAYSDE